MAPRRPRHIMGKRSFPCPDAETLPVSALRLRYAHNLSSVSPLTSNFLELAAVGATPAWLEGLPTELGVADEIPDKDYDLDAVLAFALENGTPHATAQRREKLFRKSLQRHLGRLLAAHKPPAPYLRRRGELGRALGLDEEELDILECVCLYKGDLLFETYCDDFIHYDWPVLIAAAIGHPHAAVRLRLTGTKGMFQRDLVRFENCEMQVVRMASHYLCGLCDTLVSEEILSPQPESPHPLESFPLNRTQRRILVDLIRKPGPCNILLHGQPGTGKTELARALGRVCGRQSLLVRFGADGTTMDRRAALTGAFSLASTDALLMVDEADGILNTDIPIAKPTVDKGWINNMLDEGRHKVIWIANHIDAVEDSVLRRFAYSVEFKAFTEPQRRSVWEDRLRGHPLASVIGPDLVRHLAGSYEVDAGGIASSLKALETLLHDAPAGEDAVRELLDSMLRHHEKLSGKGRNRDRLHAIGHAYTPEALHTDIPVEGILRALACREKRGAAASGKLPANLLFWGMSGTGKTEFAKHLAQHLGKPLLVKRMSDLQGMFVGQTEKRIAEVFREAAGRNAILFLDEADSLILDRQTAVRSWESSQTNEVLTQMENFSGICICCTNLIEHLDEAVLRRFTWKVKFLPLSTDGKRLLFRRYFLDGATLDPVLERTLVSVPNLTPGDFKTVWQRHQYLENPPPPADIIGELAQEASYKRLPGGMSIGFATV